MKNISKKFLSLLISVCMVISVFPLTASAAGVSKSWHYVGDSGFSEENYPSGSQVVLDSGNNPYVIYMSGNSLYVKKYNGENWEPVGDAISSVSNGYTLAVNHDGTPYVAYRDAATSKNAYVVKYADSGWQPVGSALSTDGAASAAVSTIAFDSRGTPYIAYQYFLQDRYSNTWKAAVKKYNGSSWESVGSDDLSGNANCLYSSIGFDSDDTLYTCMDEGRKPVVLKYMGGWNPVGGSDLPDSVSNLSFTVSRNTLYLAYTDTANNYETTVKKCRAGSNSWAAAGDPFPDGDFGASYLVLAAGGSSLFLLQSTMADGGIGGTTCIKELSGTSWEDLGNLGSDSPFSLAAGSDDTPYIAYSDNANAGAISLKEYSSSECTVSYAAGAHGTLSSSDPETVTSGESPSHVPTVTPANGYSFAGWSSDGGKTRHTDLSGVTISSNVTYTAYYSRIFSNNAVWKPVGAPGFSGESATYESLVIDSNNTPYIAYKGSSSGNAVMKYISGGWQAVQASDSSTAGYYSIFPTLALDGNNTPYVAYQAMDQHGTAVVKKYTGSSWQTVGSLSSGQANYISMAVGKDGAPYVAYEDYSLSNKLIVKKYSGGTWQNFGSASGISADRADYVSFALDSNDTPYVAYRDTANANKATVMKYTGSDWETLGTAGISAGTANYTSLAIDGDGSIYLAYEDGGNHNKVTVINYDAETGNWATVGNAGFSGGDSPCVSLALDGAGTPYVAYQDCANDYKATVMKFNGTDWETAGNADFSAGSVNFVSLAFDGEGTPYVVYQDNVNNGGATVMKLTEPSACTVTYAAGTHGTLSSSDPETVTAGRAPSHVPTVTPASGYTFAGWSSDGGTTQYTAEQLEALAVSADVTYTACYIRTFPSDAVWKTVGNGDFSAGGVIDTAFAVGSNGTLYAAYTDMANSNKATVMKYTTDGGWQAVGSVGFSENTARDISLALGSDDTPYVSFASGSDETIEVMKYTAADGWQAVGSTGAAGGYTSLKIGSDGTTPYLAYQDKDNSHKATVRKYTGGNWELVGSAGFSVGTAYNTSLVLDSNNTPYVAYEDAANGYKATVMKYTGGSWQAVGISGFSGGNANSIALTLDGSGTPYVAYQDVSNSSKATVMKYAGGSWQAVGSVGFSAGEADFISLAIDSCGTPYIVYEDCNSRYKATAMKYTGSGWQTVGRVGFTADNTTHIALAFDSSDTPYVLYRDYNDKAAVMTYEEGTSYTVTYSAGDHGSLNGSTTETVLSGGCPQSVPTITPNAGYIFTGWSCDGGTTLVTGDDISEQEVTANVTYTAYYTNNCWEDVGTPGFTPGEADNVSSVMDKNGAIYAAFDDRTNSNDVSVMKYSPESGTWSALGSPLAGTYQPSIALDSSGTPYVVYYEGDANQISVAKYTGVGATGWETVGASELTGSDNIQDFHLTMAGNTPYVAYTYLAEDANKVAVMKYDGTNWVQVGTKGFSSSYRVSIQTNSQGTPYVAISDLNSDNMATVLKYTGSGTSGWETVGTAGFSNSTFSHISLAFSPDGTPYVCYDAGRIPLGRSLQGSVTRFSRVMKYTGSGSTGWEIVGSNSFTDLGTTRESFLAIDTDGTPYVAFEAGGTDWKINVRKFNGIAWTNVGNANFSAGEAQFPSLMLRDGIPYVVYQDMEASGKATSKRLISYTVTYQAGQHGRITGSENEAVFPNGHPTHIPTAVPDSGYTFAGWSRDGGRNLLTSAQVASANINANVTYTANFAGHGTPSNPSSSSTTTARPSAPSTQTQVNPAGNTSTVTTVADSVTTAGDTAQITATVTNVTTDTTGTSASLDTGKAAKVEIELPKDAIEQQLAAKKDVDLTVTVPHSVTQGADSDLSLDINASSGILAAAKASGTDLTIHIKDADTQQVAYTWTFRGADLATSTTPVVDVNVSMAVRLTTEVPQVNRITPDRLGLVLMFDHSGVLPSTASVTFSVKEKGFKPGQKLYFYYYNKLTGQIEPQDQEYTVDADGNVTVKISHCSNYVLLPNLARTITLDTRSYTMAPGQSYITGVKLTGVSGVKIKAYSSTKGVADVTVLKNGNVKATGVKPGLTYIMIDVYDGKNKLLTHASVRLTVKSIIKPSGNSARQYGIF